MAVERIVNAISFDVEDWFQVSAFEELVRFEDWGRQESRVTESTLRILDLLDRRRTRATFFVLGWVAERRPELVREIARRGHETACHGYAHRLVYRMSPEEFREDARRGKEAVEAASGQPALGYRAASFSIVEESLWGLPILAGLGFEYDSSIFPVRHDRYGIPGFHRFPRRIGSRNGTGTGTGNGNEEEKSRWEIVEFPPSTARWGGMNIPVAGGGYLRLLSSRFVSWGLRQVNREGQPGIIYLHPWELDPDQPRLPCRWSTRLRHYSGLRRTEAALSRLLAEFEFAPVAEVLRARGLLAS